MILLIDNYDSFVHNLARYFRRLGEPTEVVRNDRLVAADVERWQPTAIVLSPGPQAPDQAGCCLEIVRRWHGRLPLLGVCLGHQVIGQALGGRVVASEPMHGTSSLARHGAAGLFAGLPNPLCVARYHSLVLERETLPADVRVTAETEDGIVMAVEHATAPTVGVQFHPESILTDDGFVLLANFLRLTGRPVPADLATLAP